MAGSIEITQLDDVEDAFGNQVTDRTNDSTSTRYGTVGVVYSERDFEAE